MKVLLGWSGEESRQVALALHDWLPSVLTSLEDVWMSDEDLKTGSPWTKELQQQLEQSNAFIACITPDNITSPWLHYEAATIARNAGNPIVCPYLFGLQQDKLTGPLTQFQTASADHDGTLALVQALNESSGLPIEKSRMKKIFDTWWPQLDAELRVIQVKRLVSVERVADGIKCLIQSSNLPMLFLDRELILQSCNDEFASLIGVRPGEILNKHWSFSLELFARRVPPLIRAEFLKTQSEMIESPSTMEGLVAPNLGGHRDAVVYIDNRDIAKGDRYPHLYRVWIHADKVEGYGEVIGIFAVYRLEKLLDDTKTEDLRSITIGID